jgi:membrane protein YqaA with SNARE-associated domain
MVRVSDTRVATCGGLLNQTSPAWLLVVVAVCGSVVVLGVSGWLLGVDSESIVRRLGDLLRLLGSLPT